MWDGNPSVWNGFSPILFPIVGALKDDTYFYKENEYTLPKHGFFRKNEDIDLVKQTSDSMTLKLSSNDELYAVYPFHFELLITFTLNKNTITVNHSIINCDTTEMYASIGGHPAFKCPLYDNESYTDYFLNFDTAETSECMLLDDNNLISAKKEPVFNTKNTINLHPNIFDNDALIFDDLKSKKVTLTSKTKGPIVSVTLDDFPFLGIWAKPNSNYVCIEPWLGITDYNNTNMQLKDKVGIIKIEGKQTYNAAYTIEIHEEHLL